MAETPGAVTRMAKGATADVCVVGGGPAGSSSASRLAALGYDVVLVERPALLHTQCAATLPPTILPLLDLLGAREAIERSGFLRISRRVVWWSGPTPEVSESPGAPSFSVDRAVFDKVLVDHAAANGVRVLRSTSATQPERLSDGGWRVGLRGRGSFDEVVTRFVVDASGGCNLIPVHQVRMSPPLIALWASWWTSPRAVAEARVEAADNAWFWSAPLSDGRTVVAAFTDPRLLTELGRQGIRAAYDELLQQFRLFPGPTARAGTLVGACDASIRMAREVAGPGYVKAGDASTCLDPLSSQGVLSAVASGIQAATVINTVARRPEFEDAAMAFYRDRLRERFEQHIAKTSMFYSARAAVCDRPFWRERASHATGPGALEMETTGLVAESKIRLSHAARIEPTPALTNDVIAPVTGLIHPNLERPIVFFDGAEIAPLLRSIHAGVTPCALVERWSATIPRALGWNILEWLWTRRVVVAAGSIEREPLDGTRVRPA